MEQEETAITRQRGGKHVSATTEELLQEVFFMWSLLTVTLANDRPVLSLERVSHIKKPVTIRQ
jgi:hypothetical protein